MNQETKKGSKKPSLQDWFHYPIKTLEPNAEEIYTYGGPGFHSRDLRKQPKMDLVDPNSHTPSEYEVFLAWTLSNVTKACATNAKNNLIRKDKSRTDEIQRLERYIGEYSKYTLYDERMREDFVNILKMLKNGYKEREVHPLWHSMMKSIFLTHEDYQIEPYKRYIDILTVDMPKYWDNQDPNTLDRLIKELELLGTLIQKNVTVSERIPTMTENVPPSMSKENPTPPKRMLPQGIEYRPEKTVTEIIRKHGERQSKVKDNDPPKAMTIPEMQEHLKNVLPPHTTPKLHTIPPGTDLGINGPIPSAKKYFSTPQPPLPPAWHYVSQEDKFRDQIGDNPAVLNHLRKMTEQNKYSDMDNFDELDEMTHEKPMTSDEWQTSFHKYYNMNTIEEPMAPKKKKKSKEKLMKIDKILKLTKKMIKAKETIKPKKVKIKLVSSNDNPDYYKDDIFKDNPKNVSNYGKLLLKEHERLLSKLEKCKFLDAKKKHELKVDLTEIEENISKVEKEYNVKLPYRQPTKWEMFCARTKHLFKRGISCIKRNASIIYKCISVIVVPIIGFITKCIVDKNNPSPITDTTVPTPELTTA